MTKPIEYTRDTDVEDNVPARPETQPGVQSDSDLTDMPNACAPAGYIDETHFPRKVPSVAVQEERAASRLSKGKCGADATTQTLSMKVPFSGTALTMGGCSSAGGSGAALTTGGNVFIGATGVLGMQAASAFTGQTNDAIGLYSDAGIQAHSQTRFEIYAGGGTAPGTCGGGGPAGTGPTTKPAEGAEQLTNVACNVVGVAKAANDIVNVVRDGKYGVSEVATLLKGGTDAVNKGVVANMLAFDPKNDTLKTIGASLDTASAVFGLGSAVTKPNNEGLAILSTAISSLSTTSNAWGATKYPAKGIDALGGGGGHGGGGGGGGGHDGHDGHGGGGGGGGGGSTDIEERAAGSVKMVCNVKITGNAPEAIDWKTATKFGVNAVALVDFATTNWGAFAALKFEVKCPGVTEMICKKFDMKAYGSGTMKSKAIIDVTATELAKLDGKVRVTKTFITDKESTFKAKLIVKKDTLFNQSVTVKMAGVIKGDTVIDKPCDFRKNLTVNGKVTSMGALTATASANLG